MVGRGGHYWLDGWILEGFWMDVKMIPKFLSGFLAVLLFE